MGVASAAGRSSTTAYLPQGPFMIKATRCDQPT
jgi:hypothetical protein